MRPRLAPLVGRGGDKAEKGGKVMRIGEIVEYLIGIKDDYPPGSTQEEAVIEACNLLDKLPRMEEATKYGDR